MPFCDISSLRIHYHIYGEGPPLLLIIGLSGDLKWWERLIPELENDFQIITFDNRGAGLTDKPDSKYSIRMFAADTIEFMDKLNLSKAHIFGISMGGMIAQEIALMAPDRIDRLALGCTHSGGKGFYMPPAEAIKQMSLRRKRSPLDIARQTIMLQFGPNFHKKYPEHVKALTKHYLINQPPPLAASRQFWAAWKHNCYDRLPEISMPTLLLAGDADALLPSKNLSVLLSRIPNARLAKLPGCGHAFFIEAPKATAKLLKEHFL